MNHNQRADYVKKHTDTKPEPPERDIERESEITICELCGTSFFGDPSTESLCRKCKVNKDWMEYDPEDPKIAEEIRLWKLQLKDNITKLTKHLSVIERLKKGC